MPQLKIKSKSAYMYTQNLFYIERKYVKNWKSTIGVLRLLNEIKHKGESTRKAIGKNN